MISQKSQLEGIDLSKKPDQDLKNSKTLFQKGRSAAREAATFQKNEIASVIQEAHLSKELTTSLEI